LPDMSVKSSESRSGTGKWAATPRLVCNISQLPPADKTLAMCGKKQQAVRIHR
jgi:hypothetical protein